MTTVVNKYKVNMDDPDIVYIGRGSVWGNPHVMRYESQRDKVISEYRLTLWARIQRGEVTKEMLIALDGKILACYCAPKPCHGDVLKRAVQWAKEQS